MENVSELSAEKELQLAKRRAYWKEYRKRPEVIAKRRAYDARPARKKHAQETYKKRYANAEVREKHHEYWAEYSKRPETIEVRRKYREKPESIQRHNEQARADWKRARDEMGNVASEQAKKQKLKMLKYKASGRSINWEITDEEAWETLHKECNYCGEASSVWTDETRQCATIDRIDSSGHYTTDNIVPACLRCNLMKNDLTTEVFIAHIEKILAHMQTKKTK